MHICIVNIESPTFKSMYAEAWVYQNGCNATLHIFQHIMKMLFGFIMLSVTIGIIRVHGNKDMLVGIKHGSKD